MTCGKIFAAASEHEETSVAEQAPVPCGIGSFCSGSRLAGESCAAIKLGKNKSKREAQLKRISSLLNKYI